MSYSQRESPILGTLCERLVQDQYGELAARVFSIFARYGRQTLAALTRASYLNGRQIKHGLVVLIQQHLIFHSSADPRATSYEVDWAQAYALVRYGKISVLVENRMGKEAANVVSNLLSLGHTRVADLKEAYFPSHKASAANGEANGLANGAVAGPKANGVKLNGTTPKTNGAVEIPSELDDAKLAVATLTNGDAPTENGTANGTPEMNGNKKRPISEATKSNGIESKEAKTSQEAQMVDGANEIKSVDDLERVLERLIDRGWVVQVDETHYLSPGDAHILAREQVMDESYQGSLPSGTKAKEMMNQQILERKREIRDDALKKPHFVASKRAAPDNSPPQANKRTKLNNGETAIAIPGMVPAQPTSQSQDRIVLRVNLEKVAVAMRTDALVRLVEQRLGHVTAECYKIMLYHLERHIPRCWDELEGEIVPFNADLTDPRFRTTSQNVAKKLDRKIDVFEGLDPATVVKEVGRNSKVDSKNRVHPPLHPHKISLDIKAKIVDKHINMLAEDPLRFVTWVSRNGVNEWTVQFDEISKAFVQAEIEKTIEARKGPLGVKLVRALKKKGKLDERQTSIAMMMSATEIRGVVNDLAVQGYVQTQEIPKVDRREAKLTMIYTWYDIQRAREKLLHDTYKGMVRILQRLEFESKQRETLLRKAERSDVVGNETKWLSKFELEKLKEWRDIEEKLLLQLEREDEVVAVVRDFVRPMLSI
ncbi:DNA directed RNA polymeras-like protein III subunit Rpc82 [Amniculicola lignicola CBS 123094]|uniref:DNA-directed RNA polymerase III subunit RPC3 n=1 Tax=Amniculicola lignicola CBS 123094 TaxID=1392246 RepID=A0A6A5WWI5_9PLEO|nr:DNA directed RNA polymeras-like protein III subunit Rpc82 [Amniculicola lignicola CBS 123094]